MFKLRDEVFVLLHETAVPAAGFVAGVSYGYDAVDVRLNTGELLLGLPAVHVRLADWFATPRLLGINP